jgi:hypothetical protein
MNPFADDIVTEPRRVGYSVANLNRQALDRLLEAFASLERGVPPRRPAATSLKAQLVISPDRGYGKSHLLGRLFKELDDRATLIYLRPFQDPDRYWQSVLLASVQELERPDHAGLETPENPSQLEILAHGVLAHLLANYFQHGDPQNREENEARVAHLRQDPLAVFGPNNQDRAWADWLRDKFVSLHSDLALEARRNHLELDGKEEAWLKVFFAYAHNPPSSLPRKAALRWLRAETIEHEDVQALNLHSSDNDANPEASHSTQNALCCTRLRGLCQWASYYRPFVFCFDQTEFYAANPSLIKTLGRMVEGLFSDFPHQLTVVTANQNNWLQDILPAMETPHHDRFSPPINLQGINRGQAMDLLRHRLEEAESSADIATSMADATWIESTFPARSTTMGVREFLVKASRRYCEITSTPPVPDLSLEELFANIQNEFRSKPSQQRYSQDAIIWFIQELAAHWQDVEVRPIAENRYFQTFWESNGRRRYFAIEGGSHHKRWHGIASSSLCLCPPAALPKSRCCIFRTPDLEAIPRTSWNAMRSAWDQAVAGALLIWNLSTDEIIELYAARELHAGALSRDIDYSAKEVLDFLGVSFAPWKERLFEFPVVPPPDPTPPSISPNVLALRKDVEMIVERHRFLALGDLLRQLPQSSEQNVLGAIEGHPRIRIYPGPRFILLQWRHPAST